MQDRARWTVRAGAAAFAVGLLLSLLARARPEVALLRALVAAALMAVFTLLATSLNHQPEEADDDGNSHESTG